MINKTTLDIENSKPCSIPADNLFMTYVFAKRMLCILNVCNTYGIY